MHSICIKNVIKTSMKKMIGRAPYLDSHRFYTTYSYNVIDPEVSV